MDCECILKASRCRGVKRYFGNVINVGKTSEALGADIIFPKNRINEKIDCSRNHTLDGC